MPRTVRIEQANAPSSNSIAQPLSLAEVEVFRNSSNITQVSGVVATQSSTLHGATADLAIDGNTNTDFSAGSVTHTASELNPWWQVDLGSDGDIDSIAVHARRDGTPAGYDQLTHFRIEVLDVNENVLWFEQYSNGQPNPSVTFTPPQFVPDPGIEIVENAAGVSVNEAGGTETIEVQLLSPPTSSVTLDVASSDTGEATVDTATLSFDSSNWNIPQAVTVTGVDDSIADGNVTASVTFSVASGSASEYSSVADAIVSVANIDSELGLPQSVRISQSNSYCSVIEQPLSLAEVEVFLDSSNVTQVSGVVATQSSTLHGATADLAIDGNTNTDFSAGSVTHTASELNPWWRVQLASADEIDDITVHARRDGSPPGYDQLTHFRIEVLDVNENVLWFEQYSNGQPNPSVTFSPPQFVPDPGIEIVESTAGVSVNEAGGTDAIEVQLLSPPTTPVTLNVISSDTGEVTVDTATLVFDASNWNIPQAVTVTGVDDTVAEGDKSASVSFSVASGSANEYASAIDAIVSVQIIDNEAGSPRYIRIEQTNAPDSDSISQPLTLAELQAFKDGVNLAQLPSAVASQSSTLHGATADRAIDGSTNADFAADSVTHTYSELNPWWEVDLGINSEIDEIHVWGRSDGPSPEASGYNQLTHFRIEVLDSKRNVLWAHLYQEGQPIPSVGFDPPQFLSDPALLVSLTDGSTEVDEGGTTDTLSVSLKVQPTSEVVVQVTPGEEGEFSVDKKFLFFDSSDWDIPQSVTIEGNDDLEMDGDTEGAVKFSITGISSPEYANAPSVWSPVTVLDNEPAPRYVRIERDGNLLLSIAEVQVFHNGVNLATNPLATALQSSTNSGGGAAEYAIDGITDGDWNNSSVALTNAQEDPWWELDLGLSSAIDELVVWARTDSGGFAQLADFDIVVLDEQRNQVWWQSYTSGQPTPSQVFSVGLSGIRAEHLSVQLLGEGDFNGDGRDDQLYFDPTSRDLLVHSSGDLETYPEIWGSTGAVDPATVRISEFSGDGQDDVAYRNDQGEWVFAVSESNQFLIHETTASPSWHEDEVLVGDFDANGTSELIGRADGAPGNSWSILSFQNGGFQIDSAGSSFISATNAYRGNIFIGDVNRDGRDDLVGAIDPAAANSGTGASWYVSTSRVDVSADAITLADSSGIDTDFGDWFDGYYFNVDGNEWIDTDGPYRAYVDAFLSVYNNIEVQFYEGLLKGPQATEETGRGNSWDQAGLLSSKLSDLGITNQIVSGRLDVDHDVLRQWVGTIEEEATQLLLYFSLGGVTGDVKTNSQLFDHAWLQAKVPTASGLEFVDVDPAWKFKEIEAGIDIQLDYDELDYIANADGRLPIEYFEDEVIELLASQHPGKSLADVPFDGPIVKLFDTTGFQIPENTWIDQATGITVLGSLSTLLAHSTHPGTYASRVRISADGWFKDLVLPESSLDYHSIALNSSNLTYFVNGVQADQVAYTSGMTTVSIELAAPGDAFGAANNTKYSTSVSLENDDRRVTFSLDVDQFSVQELIRRRESIVQAEANGVTVEDIDALAYYVSAQYWHDQQAYSRQANALMQNIAYLRGPQAGFVLSDNSLVSGDHSHLQTKIVPQNFGVDLPGGRFGAFDMREDSLYPVGDGHLEAFQLAGFTTSALESAVIEEAINTESISTIRGLVEAFDGEGGVDGSGVNSVWVLQSVDDLGRKLYLRGELGVEQSAGAYNYPYSATRTDLEIVSETQLMSWFPEHPQDVIESIYDELTTDVSGTATVLMPEGKSYAGDASAYWEGSVYLREKTNSSGFASSRYAIKGTGGQTMDGGFSGGVVKSASEFIQSAATTITNFAGDPVNILNGNMFRDETDIVMANMGVPIALSRHYDSQSPLISGFGEGWVHSFGDRLLQDPTQSDEIIWLTDQGVRHTFERVGGVWKSPPELLGVLSEDSGAGTFAYKSDDGIERHFATVSSVAAGDGLSYIARLASIIDRNGHGAQVTYDAVNALQIDAVQDMHDPARRLDFGYDVNGQIDEVAKVVNGIAVGTWTYSYQGTQGERLSNVTNPLDEAVAFDHHADGTIKSIIEPDGSYHAYEYYQNGRVFRVKEGVYDGTNYIEESSHSFSYDLFRNTTEFINENGRVETYEHQEDGRLVKHIFDDRTRIETVWGVDDGQGGIIAGTEYLMRSQTDEVGETESFEYFVNETGSNAFKNRRLKKATDKLGAITEFDYSESANAVHIVNPIWIKRYPSGGTQTRETHFSYDSYGRITGVTNAEGNQTTTEYYSSGPNIGLAKSRQFANGIFSPSHPAYSAEVNEAVTWRVLSDGFSVTGDALTVRLEAFEAQGAVIADAVRVERIDGDGLGQLIRVSDDAISGNTDAFALYSTGGNVAAVSTSSSQFHGDSTRLQVTSAGQQNHATWTFENLVPGTYRVSATWSSDPYADSSASYKIYDADETTGLATEIFVDQQQGPDSGDAFNAFKKFFQYDSAGNVIQESYGQSSVGGSQLVIHTASFHHTGAPNTTVDGAGVETKTSRDVVGRAVSVTLSGNSQSTSDDLVTSFEYDERGRVTKESDPLGNESTFQYDRRGNVVQQRSADGAVVQYDYDLVGNRVRATDPLGNTTHYLFDSRNRVIQITYADGAIDRVVYDGAGRPKTTVDALGRETVFTYTADGQLASRTDAVGISSYHKYNEFGEKIESIDEFEEAGGNKKVTQFSRDSLGRVVKRMVLDSSDALNPTVTGSALTSASVRPVFVETRGYDFSGNPVEAIVYDTFDDLDRIQTADLLASDLRDRVDGGLTAVSGSLGNNIYQRTVTQYDAMNRVTGTVFADGTRVAVEYDGGGRTMYSVGKRGARSQNTYDVYGRLSSRIFADPDGPTGAQERPVTRFYYDAAGNQIANTDANGNWAFYEYDALNRITGVTNALDQRDQTVFDTAGRIVAVIDAAGSAVASRYDERGRLIQRQWKDVDGIGTGLAPVESWEYDLVGNRILAVDPRGFESSFTYDDLNRLTEERRQRAEFFSGQSMTSGTEAVTMYAYDGAGNLASEVVSDGSESYTTTYGYDELGRQIKVVLPDPDEYTGPSGPLASPVIRNTFDGYGNLVSTATGIESTIYRTDRYEYDALNRRTAETHNANESQATADDRVRNEWEYDAAGNLVATHQAVNSPDTTINVTHRFEYDFLNRRIVERFNAPTTSDSGQHYTTYSYDAAGNLIEETFSVVDPISSNENSTTTGHVYDALHRAVATIDDLGGLEAESNVEFDAVGNVSKEIDAEGVATTFEYDALYQITKSTLSDPDPADGQPSALVTTYAYDVAGNLVSTVNGAGDETQFVYNAFGQVALERDVIPGGADIETVFIYDFRGNLAELQDPNDNVTTFQHDGLNRLVEEKRVYTSSTQVVAYQYDDDGTLGAMADMQGRLVEYAYDGLDRLVTETWNDGSSDLQVLEWAYDKRGRVVRSYVEDNRYAQQQVYTDTYLYDAMDRVTQHLNSDDGVSAPRGNPQLLQTFSYDHVDSLGANGLYRTEYKQVFEPSNNTSPDLDSIYVDASLEIDSLGRRSQITEAGDAVRGIASKDITFGYDLAGRLLTVTRLADTDNNGATGTNGLDFYFKTDYTYDDAGRLDQIEHRRGSSTASPFATYDYAYDDASRISMSTNVAAFGSLSLTRDEVYGYDDAGRLGNWDYTLTDSSSTISNKSVDREYTFDAAGNRDDVKESGVTVNDQTIDEFNRISSDSDFSYTYDFEGNLTTRDDGAGDYREYAWDHRNRLSEVLIRPGSGQSPTDRIRYLYNNDNLRVRKIVEAVDGAGNWDIAGVEHYVYQGDQLVAVLEGGFTDNTGSDDVTTTQGSYKRRVLGGPFEDMPIYEEEFLDTLIHGSTQSGPYWTATDHAGSVRDVILGKDELFAQHVEYDVFGEIEQVLDDAGTAHSLDQLAVDAAFSGRRWDADADLYYNRARWYDASQARFISEDPIGHAGGINLYVYADNSPATYRDPTGHAAKLIPFEGISNTLSTAAGLFSPALGDFGGAISSSVSNLVGTYTTGLSAGLTGFASSVSSSFSEARFNYESAAAYAENIGITSPSDLPGTSDRNYSQDYALMRDRIYETPSPTVKPGSCFSNNCYTGFTANNRAIGDLVHEPLDTEKFLDGLQTFLDGAGFLGPVGPAADLLNAGISGLRGDWAGAGINIVATIPLFGDGIKATKMGANAFETVARHGDSAYDAVRSSTRSSGVTPKDVVPDVRTGAGYGVNDPPVRIQGEWSDNDLKAALLGHPPRGLESPDLHHAGQMPGSAIHEVLPSQHRGNKVLHPNKRNQGVTAKMRKQDRELHWWYRAREQGADARLPDWIYDD